MPSIMEPLKSMELQQHEKNNELPVEGAVIGSAVWSELEVMAQNMEILCFQKMTFFEKHRQQYQQLGEVQVGIPPDQIPTPDPATSRFISQGMFYDYFGFR